MTEGPWKHKPQRRAARGTGIIRGVLAGMAIWALVILVIIIRKNGAG